MRNLKLVLLALTIVALVNAQAVAQVLGQTISYSVTFQGGWTLPTGATATINGSFPSGHTMRATFLAGTLLRGIPLVACASVLLMMAALVYLGDHWATDVLGGLCLGWACVEVAQTISGRLS